MIKSEKYLKLKQYLKSLDGCTIAYSGGTDSSLLLYMAKYILGNNVLAITANCSYMSDWEIEEAKEFTSRFQIRHKIIDLPIIDSIRNNPEDRCYLCKKAIFSEIIKESKAAGIDHVFDGTNKDDIGDYRPGRKALKELKVESPLLRFDIGKEEIRTISKELSLPTWDKPAMACTLSRLPHNVPIKEEELERIKKSERYLLDTVFKSVRVRSHGEIARIEVSRSERKKLFDEQRLDEISKQLKQFGYKFVTFELEGYKMGNMNPKKK